MFILNEVDAIIILVVIVIVVVIAMATMLNYHNLFVMSVHVAVVVAILLDDDRRIFSFRRRGKWHCNSESRECRKSDGKLAH
jgi:lysylphosphatidylglycerol synthetase-like protein (DUF2156 family)